VTAEHVDHLRAQVAPDLFSRFNPDHFPHTSLPALALAAAGYRQSDRSGEAISLALRDALFEEGRDISLPDVLASIANTHGVAEPEADDRQTVLKEWHQGQSRGVKGSPHFFCGDCDVFCPSLDISKDDQGHLQLRRDPEAFDAFLAVCFK